MYFFGGVAKLNGDWLRGEPMRTWLARRTDFGVLGRWFESEWLVTVFTYGGLLLDLLAVPLLLWRRTRLVALAALAVFNAMNDQLFSIGVFPYLAFAGALLFLDPPRRPAVKAVAAVPDTQLRTVTLGLLAAFVALQVLVPLRHLAYPGPANWTEEGHQFAWHMKLRSKSGQAVFTATDPGSGQQWIVDPGMVLESWQTDKMAIRPELIRQFAVFVADDLADQGHPGVEVRAEVWASLNGRELQRLIDPGVDLAAQPPSLAPRSWILPLVTPLPTT